MKIKREEIEKTIKILKDLKYKPLIEKSTFFFEIDCGQTVESGEFILEEKDEKQFGSAGFVKPGLIVSVGEKKTLVSLAYAQTEYCSKFNLMNYISLVDAKALTKKDKDFLSDKDVLLIKNEYILAEFEI